jgi:hypothetical protein
MSRRDKDEILPPKKEAELNPSNGAQASPARAMNAQEAEPPAFSKTAREKILTMIERESSQELSERGLMVDIMGKLAIAESDKNRMLELYDKARHKEGARRNDFELSQRQFLWLMMASKERDTDHIKNLNEAFIGMVDKYAEVKQADAKSKAGEIVEVLTLVSQIPIFVALQELAMKALSKKKPLDDPKKERLRQQLQAQLKAIEDDDEE